MPILQAQIQTDRASRYLVQFCKHAAAMGGGGHTPRMHLHAPTDRREVQVTAEWSDTDGTVTFTPWGRITLAADVNTLTVCIDAVDEDGLAQSREVVTRNLERFSRRNPLTVTWQRSETPGAAPFRPDRRLTAERRRGFPRSRLRTILIALSAVLVVGLHVGLAGTVVAESWWAGVAVDVVVALAVLKIALVAAARFGIRRRATRTSDQT